MDRTVEKLVFALIVFLLGVLILASVVGAVWQAGLFGDVSQAAVRRFQGFRINACLFSGSLAIAHAVFCLIAIGSTSPNYRETRDPKFRCVVSFVAAVVFFIPVVYSVLLF